MGTTRIPFLDKPGNTVSDFGVNQLILLFASNSFTGHTYYFDNFDIYTLSNTVGIQSIDIPKALKIFPNPIVDQLSLNWDGNETLLSAQLYDTTGKQIRNVFPRAKDFIPGHSLIYLKAVISSN